MDETFIRQQVKNVLQQVDSDASRRIAIQHMGDRYDEAIAERLREKFETVKIVGAGWFWIEGRR